MTNLWFWWCYPCPYAWGGGKWGRMLRWRSKSQWILS